MYASIKIFVNLLICIRSPVHDPRADGSSAESGYPIRLHAVSCGSDFTVVLTSTRASVWSFGRNDAHQCGHAIPQSPSVSWVPRRVIPYTGASEVKVTMDSTGKLIEHRKPAASRKYYSISCGPEQVWHYTAITCISLVK